MTDAKFIRSKNEIGDVVYTSTDGRIRITRESRGNYYVEDLERFEVYRDHLGALSLVPTFMYEWSLADATRLGVNWGARDTVSKVQACADYRERWSDRERPFVRNRDATPPARTRGAGRGRGVGAMTVRDTQRSAVYAWERALPQWVSRGEMTLAECRALVARVWEDYRPGAQRPDVVDGRGTRWARGGRSRISLPLWSRSALVVLHETAHSLTTDNSHHGPDFARLCLDLFERYGGVDRREAIKIAQEQKPRQVHFALAGATPQRASRAYAAWAKERAVLTKAANDATAALRAHVAMRPAK